MWIRPKRKPVRVVSVVAVLALLGAACTSTDVVDTTTPPTLNTAQPTDAPPPATTLSTTTADTSTTSPVAPDTTQPSTTTTTLPGAPYNGPGPQAGDVVAVVGVAHDDVLMVRTGPGSGYDPVASLEPTATEIPVTGAAWLLPTAIWYEIIPPVGEPGWVNDSYIGLMGSTDDVTTLVHRMLGTPLADDDLLALGATIANAFLSDEGGGWIALVEQPESGSTTAVSSVTYDAMGVGDDSIKGYRLVIHATQDVADGPYLMHSVEQTLVCLRGIDAEGFCV